MASISNRIICLDTETTGLSATQGDRIIEIGCVEIIDRSITEQSFHYYLNPEGKSIDEGAQKVHGISAQFLEDKPTFAQIVASFLDFIQGATVVIHNAPFDIGFLNAELKRLEMKSITIVGQCTIIDTLVLAKTHYPGKRNSLDALCDRFGINRSNRTLHGALLDARLLADVYLNLTRSQESLDSVGYTTNNYQPQHLTSSYSNINTTNTISTSEVITGNIIEGIAFMPIQNDYDAHTAYLELLDKESKGKTVWRTI